MEYRAIGESLNGIDKLQIDGMVYTTKKFRVANGFKYQVYDMYGLICGMLSGATTHFGAPYFRGRISTRPVYIFITAGNKYIVHTKNNSAKPAPPPPPPPPPKPPPPRKPKVETPYNILGINVSATPDEIKRAFRLKAKIHHPDCGGNAAEFIKIRVAYETLKC